MIYKDLIISMLDCLADEEIKRVYKLVEYLGIHKKKGDYDLK